MSLKFKNQKEEAVYRALDSLCKALELRGESGTEKTFYILSEVFSYPNYKNMSDILKESHDEGLCCNMLFPITELILEISKEYKDG